MFNGELARYVREAEAKARSSGLTEGRQKGREEGREEGRREARLELLQMMGLDGASPDDLDRILPALIRARRDSRD